MSLGAIIRSAIELDVVQPTGPRRRARAGSTGLQSIQNSGHELRTGTILLIPLRITNGSAMPLVAIADMNAEYSSLRNDSPTIVPKSRAPCTLGQVSWSKYMSRQPNKSVHYLPEPPGGTHAEILAEITRPPSPPSSPAASIIDISAPLARLEDAWRHVEACSERIQDLESLVDNLNKREAHLTAEWDAAKRRCTELEAELSAEKQHCAKAEGAAAAISARANELEQALSDSNHNLETLAGAVEVALQGVPGRAETQRAAA
jgi:hypothetical protein